MKNKLNIAALFVVTLLVADPALAAGGLSKANSLLQNVASFLQTAGIVVATIAIMWAGYKYLFKKADLTDIAQIIGGGVLIGGAAEFAAFIMG